MFKTDVCIACKRMQSFVDDYEVDVVNLSKPENKEYIDEYSLRAVPTFIKFDTDGNEIDRRVGSMNERDFANFVERKQDAVTN